MNQNLLKICGINDAGFARRAVENGADFLGFIFFERSPRSVSVEKAEEILSRISGRRQCRFAGVFVNAGEREIRETADRLKLDVIQLHGDYPAETAASLKRDYEVWKAVSSESAYSADYPADAFLVDSKNPGSGRRSDWELAGKIRKNGGKVVLAGGLSSENLAEAAVLNAYVLDVNSSLEDIPGHKTLEKMEQLFNQYRRHVKMEHKSHYGIYGGQYVAETLMTPLAELERAYFEAKADPSFKEEFDYLMKNYVGRESPLYYAERLTKYCGGAKILLKREDLNHTGAHKVNNTIGQALLAKRMGKKKLFAETGAGMHGVATATVAALFGMECEVFMGAVDVERQSPNVERMQTLGAKVTAVTEGSGTLKDAMNEALRRWITDVEEAFYVIGTVAGPYPYPLIVRDFQSVIGTEARKQCLADYGKLPAEVIACVGGGSNAMGIFAGFVDDKEVRLIGVEAGGRGVETGEHAASICGGRLGVLHGSKCYLLQTGEGQIIDTYSVSAGLDYPGVGPEHCMLHDIGRAEYVAINDDEAIEAFDMLSRYEGIIPALESSHALAEALRRAPKLSGDDIIIVNLSGRGDKDMQSVKNYKAQKGL